MRPAALLALAGCLAACAVPAASARPHGRESWKPAKAKKVKACRSARSRRACHRWGGALALGQRFVGLGVEEPGGFAPPTVEPPPEVLSRSVQVRADEFSLTLSRTVVAAGLVTVEFNTVNAEDPHDLKARTAAGAVLPLFGETAPELIPPPRQAFELPAGNYVLFCSLAGHEGLGMRASLTAR